MKSAEKKKKKEKKKLSAPSDITVTWDAQSQTSIYSYVVKPDNLSLHALMMKG